MLTGKESTSPSISNKPISDKWKDHPRQIQGALILTNNFDVSRIF